MPLRRASGEERALRSCWSENPRLFKKVQMQGGEEARSETYLDVRENDEQRSQRPSAALASLLVVLTYIYVRLTPRFLAALHLDLFDQPALGMVFFSILLVLLCHKS